MYSKYLNSKFLCAIFLPLILSAQVRCERIKDIVDIKGVRSNPLTGYGLVIGLNGTGDGTIAPQQMLASLLRREGIVLSRSQLGQGNTALVAVTADLGPWDRVGSTIDVTVSAIGDAGSLVNGMLLATELRGADGQVYAVARGSLSTASWNVEGAAASAVRNHPTIARIPNGAHVEREELSDFVETIGGMRFVTLNLRNSDFTTAEEIRKAIESVFPKSVFVEDAGTIRVKVPDTVNQLRIAEFMDTITQLEVKVDMPAVVVINERTGTIVVGERVAISPVAISQGSLVVTIKESAQVSQPSPFSEVGNTVTVPDTSLNINEEKGYLIPVPRVVTVSELANALNRIGATPRDLISIFTGLKDAGALQAELKIH